MTAKRANITIVGCTMHSLYAGIMSLDMGHSTTILEKRSSIDYTNLYDCMIFNDSHMAYIGLLRRFNIAYTPIIDNIGLCQSLETMARDVSSVPDDILVNNSFEDVCNNVPDNCPLGPLLSSSNALDCINMIKTDFTSKRVHYKIDEINVRALCSRMLCLFLDMGGIILYNNEVKSVQHSRRFIVVTNTFYVHNCDILIMAISKNSMMQLTHKEEHRLLLEYVSMCQVPVRFLENSYDKDATLEMLLDDMHIVFPHTRKTAEYINVYTWKKGSTRSMFREGVKRAYNKRMYICGRSYSKNSMFVNYSLEDMEDCLSR